MTSSGNPRDPFLKSLKNDSLPLHERPASASLPVPLTPFIARDREVSTAINLLRSERVRLLTLTGPGGVGKTRLAIHIANSVQNNYPDGVYFISLSSIHDPDLVMPTIAQVHGNREIAGVSITEILMSYLRSRQELLVLDNFEQLVDAAPQLVDLLTFCPGITILITSQIALHIQGEQELGIRPMEVLAREPGTTWQIPPPGELAGYEAIELFIQRARSVRPDFELNDDNALAVVEICRRLDGLPLAIELAAVRTKLLSPSALLSRLASSLQVLTSGSRDMPERLQTMRSAIAWSYNLLDAQEQRLMRWLAVFSSGFTLGAAEYVAELQQSEIDIFEGVASLVDKSLLFPSNPPIGEPRFVMLETIREFALEQLSEDGELEFIRECHARWCLDLASRASVELTGPNAVGWLDRLEVEHDNLRASLGWALKNGNIEIAMEMAVNIVTFWFQRDYFTEGSMWLERAIALLSENPTPLVANTYAMAGLLADLSGKPDLAQERLEESLAIATELGDMRSIATATLGLADINEGFGNYQVAQQLAEDAIPLLRKVDEPVWLALGLSLRSLQAHRCGDTELADRLMKESLDLARQIGFGWGVAISLGNFGRFARENGDYVRALERFQESLVYCQESGNSWLIIRLLIYIADIASELGQSVHAAQLMGASEILNEQLTGTAFIARVEAIHEDAVERIHADLSRQEFDEAWSAGRRLDRDEAVASALAVSLEADGSTRSTPRDSGAEYNLTPRQIEVLQFVVAGYSDREIAEALFISPRTAQSHVSGIFIKLNVNSRTEAATAALRLGLVDTDQTQTT